MILLAQEGLSVAVKYFALFLVVPGGYITQPIVLAWVQNCMSGHYKRSISAAMTVGFGNLGGIVASNVFFTEEAPLYKTGYGVGLGFLWICGVGCVVLFLDDVLLSERIVCRSLRGVYIYTCVCVCIVCTLCVLWKYCMCMWCFWVFCSIV